MRSNWLPLVALTTGLAGCSVSVTDAVPGPHGHARHVHVQTMPLALGARPDGAAANVSATQANVGIGTLAKGDPNATTIDLAALYTTLMRVPQYTRTLATEFYVCVVIVGLVGLVNVALLLRLPHALRSAQRKAAAAPSPRPTIAAPAPRVLRASTDEAPIALRASNAQAASTAVAVHETRPASAVPLVLSISADDRICACGAAIAGRSKSGRCRRCAQISRTKRERAARAHLAPILRDLATADDSEEVDTIATAVISRSRLGERRRYYTFDVAPNAPSATGATTLEITAESNLPTPLSASRTS